MSGRAAFRRAMVLALSGGLSAACSYRLPPRALQLNAIDLDGKTVAAEALRGKPYVISLWLPG